MFVTPVVNITDMSRNIPQPHEVVTIQFYFFWVLLIGFYSFLNVFLYTDWRKREGICRGAPPIERVFFWASVFFFLVSLFAIFLQSSLVEVLHASVHENACGVSPILSFNLGAAFDYSTFLKRFSFWDEARWRFNCDAVNEFVRLVQLGASLFAIILTLPFLLSYSRVVRLSEGKESEND